MFLSCILTIFFYIILISQLCWLECTHCANPQNGLFRHFSCLQSIRGVGVEKHATSALWYPINCKIFPSNFSVFTCETNRRFWSSIDYCHNGPCHPTLLIVSLFNPTVRCSLVWPIWGCAALIINRMKFVCNPSIHKSNDLTIMGICFIEIDRKWL